MRLLSLTVLAVLLFGPIAPGALYQPASEPFTTIAAEGQTRAQIIVPDRPAYLEQFAASELQAVFEKISGVKLPVLEESQQNDAVYCILLGNTQKSKNLGISLDEETAGRDGFTLRSIPNGLVVVGRNDLGTLFGVYELVERYFDVRWFMPGQLGQYVPRRETLEVGQINLTYKPSFRVRWVGNGQWSLRQRMNAYVTAGDKSVGIKWKWHFHTFIELIPPEKYHAEHPEYFALVGGKRTVTDSRSHGNQLCTSNPDVVREVGRNLIAVLDAEPGIEIITLSPNDGGGFCECQQCTALDEPDRDWFAKYSRRLAIFNNEVARLVAAKHPQVLIKVGAYAMYARPPLDADYRPEKNLFFQLCHLYFCHNHPLGSDGCRAGTTYEPRDEFQPNQEFCRILDRWLELSPHLFVYEYYSIGGMARANLPWPLVHTMRTDIPYYRDHGVEGFYTQLSDDLWYRLGLNYYVAAKLCWNADLDVDALLDDYFEKFYGPAAAPVRSCYMTMEQSMQAWNGCASYGLQGVGGLKVIGSKVLTPEVVAAMRAGLEEAERLTAGDLTHSARVAMVRKMFDETRESLQSIGGK